MRQWSLAPIKPSTCRLPARPCTVARLRLACTGRPCALIRPYSAPSVATLGNYTIQSAIAGPGDLVLPLTGYASGGVVTCGSQQAPGVRLGGSRPREHRGRCSGMMHVCGECRGQSTTSVSLDALLTELLRPSVRRRPGAFGRLEGRRRRTMSLTGRMSMSNASRTQRGGLGWRRIMYRSQHGGRGSKR